MIQLETMTMIKRADKPKQELLLLQKHFWRYICFNLHETETKEPHPSETICIFIYSSLKMAISHDLLPNSLCSNENK